MSFCKNCGKQLVDEIKFCENCGTATNELTDTKSITNEKKLISNTWAWLFAIIGSIFSSCSVYMIFKVQEYVGAVVLLCLNLIFLLPDMKILKRNQIETGAWGWIGLIIPPVFLFKRANNTNKKYGYAITALIIFVVFSLSALTQGDMETQKFTPQDIQPNEVPINSDSANQPPQKQDQNITETALVNDKKNKETTSQKNAVRSAKQYLTITAFSKLGLIDQLIFEGYPKADAEYGVDNSGADWNEQAAKSAKAYLDLMPHSRRGLIEQLIFEKFTQDQAEFGVNSVGL